MTSYLPSSNAFVIRTWWAGCSGSRHSVSPAEQPIMNSPGRIFTIAMMVSVAHGCGELDRSRLSAHESEDLDQRSRVRFGGNYELQACEGSEARNRGKARGRQVRDENVRIEPDVGRAPLPAVPLLPDQPDSNRTVGKGIAIGGTARLTLLPERGHRRPCDPMTTASAGLPQTNRHCPRGDRRVKCDVPRLRRWYFSPITTLQSGELGTAKAEWRSLARRSRRP